MDHSMTETGCCHGMDRDSPEIEPDPMLLFFCGKAYIAFIQSETIMIFQQFRHEEGGCLSYLIGCTQRQVCAVIDSHLDIEPYVQYAPAHAMKITHIFQTPA